MDKELKDKWVAALRSGEYKQGQYALCADGGFCCLGVLCEVAGVPKERDVVDGLGRYKFADGASSTGMPDEYWLSEVIKLAPLSASKLVDMNDLENASFSEIADYIEANL